MSSYPLADALAQVAQAKRDEMADPALASARQHRAQDILGLQATHQLLTGDILSLAAAAGALIDVQESPVTEITEIKIDKPSAAIRFQNWLDRGVDKRRLDGKRFQSQGAFAASFRRFQRIGWGCVALAGIAMAGRHWWLTLARATYDKMGEHRALIEAILTSKTGTPEYDAAVKAFSVAWDHGNSVFAKEYLVNMTHLLHQEAITGLMTMGVIYSLFIALGCWAQCRDWRPATPSRTQWLLWQRSPTAKAYFEKLSKSPIPLLRSDAKHLDGKVFLDGLKKPMGITMDDIKL